MLGYIGFDKIRETVLQYGAAAALIFILIIAGVFVFLRRKRKDK